MTMGSDLYFGSVYDLESGERLRAATKADLVRSIRAEREHRDGAGAFRTTDGRLVFVEGENRAGTEMAQKELDDGI
jgi:hypothetical protein